MPTGLLRNGSMDNITYGSNFVNLEGVAFSEIVNPQGGGENK